MSFDIISRSGSFGPVSGTFKMHLALLLLMLPMLALSIPDIYYVRPDDDDYSFFDCPDQNNCFTIDEYVEETSRYFTSRSTFIFMAGNHTLRNELNLERVSYILLRGEGNVPTTDIVCKLTHNIVFTNVFRINVTGLTFLLYNYEHDRESALFVDSSIDITISKMIFLGSGDETMPLARAIESTHSNITIMDSQFKRNTGHEGGAIHASYQSNLTLVRNIFTGNRAIHSGGAIYISDFMFSRSSIIVINTTFINNAAMLYGGAVFCSCSMHCVLALWGNNTFMHNYCQAKPKDSSEGGAIYLLSGNLYINDRTYFSHNRAQQGGAIYISANSRVQARKIILRNLEKCAPK